MVFFGWRETSWQVDLHLRVRLLPGTGGDQTGGLRGVSQRIFRLIHPWLPTIHVNGSTARSPSSALVPLK